MSKQAKNGQKQTNAIEVVFNTVNGFAEKGIQFEGNYLKTEDKTYSKGVQFPGGKWMGYEALQYFINYGVNATLVLLEDEAESDNLEQNLFNFRMKGICIHALCCKYLLEGKSIEEAKNETIKYIASLPLGFSKKFVKKILDEEAMFSV